MIYHLLPQGNYSSNFTSFLIRNLPEREIEREHRFIIFTNKGRSTAFKNLVLTIKFWGSIKKGDRVILHGYMDPFWYLLCIISVFRLRYFSWAIWGGDLYFHNEPKRLKYKIYEVVRRLTIKRFGYLITNMTTDYLLSKEYYNVKGLHLFALYPITFSLEDYEISYEKPTTLKILVGNSTDPSNEHKKIFNMLSKYKDENIEIYCPLSYGVYKEYRDEVIQLGYSIFNKKFIPMITLLELNEYNRFLDQVDVMVCYHNRQQALGNIIYLLRSGKKVFIREGISTCNFFDEQGIFYSYTDSIPTLTLNEFSYIDLQQRMDNMKSISSLYSDINLVNVWQNVFDCISK